ncbi:hypothetical protein KM043_002177 [Ampulex compressa]|nr:hypothetical protein KM043_002177 [Ampulex compressa]
MIKNILGQRHELIADRQIPIFSRDYVLRECQCFPMGAGSAKRKTERDSLARHGSHFSWCDSIRFLRECSRGVKNSRNRGLLADLAFEREAAPSMKIIRGAKKLEIAAGGA